MRAALGVDGVVIVVVVVVLSGSLGGAKRAKSTPRDWTWFCGCNYAKEHAIFFSSGVPRPIRSIGGVGDGARR